MAAPFKLPKEAKLASLLPQALCWGADTQAFDLPEPL